MNRRDDPRLGPVTEYLAIEQYTQYSELLNSKTRSGAELRDGQPSIVVPVPVGRAGARYRGSRWECSDWTWYTYLEPLVYYGVAWANRNACNNPLGCTMMACGPKQTHH